MKFIIFVIDSGNNTAVPNEIEKIDAFNEHLETNGHWITAAGIESNNKVIQIDNRSNKNEVAEGSLVEGATNYSGFWLIKADSYEQAVELAKAGSEACNRKVELRPYLGN